MFEIDYEGNMLVDYLDCAWIKVSVIDGFLYILKLNVPEC